MGKDSSVSNEVYNKYHFSIKITAGVNVIITKNSFINFSGGGGSGQESDEYMYYSALAYYREGDR